MNNEGKEQLNNLRHSAAHLLAAAVMELWPDAKRAIGPAIENGFYFDFDFGDTKVTEEDFPKIEAKMREILPSWKGFEKHELTAEEAKKEYPGNQYKEELIDEFTKNGEKVTFYKSGEYWDLCKGGHVENPDHVLKHFKLLSVAGAYWRGSEKNKMLTRIYGTAFPSKDELENYLQMLEEAKKRDHKKLGKELDLFMFSDLVGPGLPIYTPKGAIIVQEIENFMKAEQSKRGYDLVLTPHLAKAELYEKSGHLQWFKDGMYPPMVFEGEGKYYAKPMNCPHHIQIYRNHSRSYRELPIRYAEFGTVYRYEQSGEINGLLRTRGFTQDDAHIFCREDQIVDEFKNVFDLTETLLRGLGLSDFWYRLSLGGSEKEKYAGNEKQWEMATIKIKRALEDRNLDYKEMPGEAAFYGPKLDILFKDSLGRDWQISTIQVDFLQPERFGLQYSDESSKQVQPYMIHRAPLGSRERIMAILIEHYGGAFPTWLSPVQVKIIPIADRHNGYGQKLLEQLKDSGVRVELDERSEKMQAKIRDAQGEKIPYMLVVGDKEEQEGKVSVRKRSGESENMVEFERFLDMINGEIASKGDPSK